MSNEAYFHVSQQQNLLTFILTRPTESSSNQCSSHFLMIPRSSTYPVPRFFFHWSFIPPYSVLEQWQTDWQSNSPWCFDNNLCVLEQWQTDWQSNANLGLDTTLQFWSSDKLTGSQTAISDESAREQRQQFLLHAFLLGTPSQMEKQHRLPY